MRNRKSYAGDHGESKIERHKSQRKNAKQNNRKTVTKELQSSPRRGEVGGENQNRNTETQSRDTDND